MLSRNLWKLVICLAVVVWAVSTLIPLQDAPSFAEFAKEKATNKPGEFARLVDEAAQRQAQGTAHSVFVGLKQIGSERKLDLTQYFPEIRLEETLRNIDRRNDILLNELLRRSRAALQLGLDLKGGIAFTLEVDEKLAADDPTHVRQEKLAKAIEIISARVNAFGVTEPIIRPVGENRIEVQLPGVNSRDNPEVVEALKKPARLDFRMVHPNLTPQMTSEIPPGYEIMTLEQEDRGDSYVEELFVKRIPEMTGEALSNAFARPDLYGRPEIILHFTSEGRARFAQVTREIAAQGRPEQPGRLAIVLDGRLYSAPSVREQIDSASAQITGSFTEREALNLANVLNNPLDLPLVVREQYEVGPTLAEDSVASAKLAFMISVALTITFILIFYTIGGVVAAIGMGINVLITLGVMASLGFTLTMPGIAGIVLTLAMSVDSNILIFERMREELKLGKSLPTALEAGFDKAWSAILDSNVTTLIVAAIMIALGTGPVKGFGVTLAIGIFSTMFAAVVVTKLVLEFLIHPGVVKKMRMFSVLQNTKFPFIRYAKPAFLSAMVVVLIGVGVVASKGRAIYGIDFIGGDRVTLTFAERLDVGALRTAAVQAGFTDQSFSYQRLLGTDVEVLTVTAPFDEGQNLVTALQAAHPQAQLQVVGETRIGPSIGEEIQWNAFWSVFWALLLILVYIAFRFEFGFGVGAVVATIHDVVVTIGIFVLCGGQFNASMVAAILLIAGYSINDTIVVFDRIREELKLDPTGSLAEIINRSLNLTLARTVITGGTTLFGAVTLMVVTSGDVSDIAFTLVIGVVVGTFSSLFIACPVFYWWHKGDRKHVEAHGDIAPKYEWQGASKASQ